MAPTRIEWANAPELEPHFSQAHAIMQGRLELSPGLIYPLDYVGDMFLRAIARFARRHDIARSCSAAKGNRHDVIPSLCRRVTVRALSIKFIKKNLTSFRGNWLNASPVMSGSLPAALPEFYVSCITSPIISVLARPTHSLSDEMNRKPSATSTTPCLPNGPHLSTLRLCWASRSPFSVTRPASRRESIVPCAICVKCRSGLPLFASSAPLQAGRKARKVLIHRQSEALCRHLQYAILAAQKHSLRQVLYRQCSMEVLQ